MAASGAGIVTYLVDLMLYKGVLNIGSIASGVIAGLVSINSGVAGVEPWAAVVIGTRACSELFDWNILCLRLLIVPYSLYILIRNVWSWHS